MIEQIESSIDFDCSLTYLRTPTLASAEETVATTLTKLNRDVEYHGKEWEAEVKRVRERNAWVSALVDSLGITRDEAGVESKSRKKSSQRASKSPKKRTQATKGRGSKRR